MITLKIRDFSCIREAEISLAQLTVMIGPQGSGKSVVSKITFFLAQFLSRSVSITHDAKGVEAFKDEIIEEFRDLFPASAWGFGRIRNRNENGKGFY